MAKTLTRSRSRKSPCWLCSGFNLIGPKDLDGVDNVEKRLAEARELIELHDRAIAAVGVQH
jgi:hypothetical protein